MSAHHTHQEITKRLKALSDQLSNGDLSEEELKEFETLSRRIYERAIVLNYKAKEAHVYSTSVSDELVEEEPSKTEESEKENSNPVQKEEPNISETAPEESGEIAFDFSSDAEDEDTISVSLTEQEEVVQKEESLKKEDSVDEQKTEKSEVVSESKEPVQEEKINSVSLNISLLPSNSSDINCILSFNPIAPFNVSNFEAPSLLIKESS